MEMVIANTPAPPPPTRNTPFRDHDVREWSRIDTITGALERARLETDSWTASTNDTCHKYGKVVDSRARTGADGTVQQQASRQLEIFQSKAAGSHLQVVKTKTVSSSRWSGKLNTNNTNLLIDGTASSVFEDLQLPLNPLDITSQKSKASVGRSVSRRPPSRQIRTQLSKDLSSSSLSTSPLPSVRNTHFAASATAATNLHRVSRLCHQIHESAVRNAFGRKSPPQSTPILVKRGSGDGSSSTGSGVKITEIESTNTTATTPSSCELNELQSHSSLTRTKSTSSDDIYHNLEKESGVKSIEDLEDLEELQNWRRTSKVRRSLQHPKPVTDTSSKLIPNSAHIGVNVKKIREELEKGRRLNTALRNNSVSTNLEALDQIIQSISSTSSVDDQHEDDLDNEPLTSKQKTKKRDSFVTVESLQEVRGRLRRTSSPSGSEMYKAKDEESDDGIVTEETKLDKIAGQTNRVKSYVYGMERMIQNKKPVMGTGSLESRSKLTNGTNSHKNEDWYNRRKSYGFEQVHNHEEPNSISLKDKKLVDSSTDSGICRSNDILVVPTASIKTNQTNGHRNSDSESDIDKKKNGINGRHCGNVKKMTSIFSQDERNPFYNNRQSADESELMTKIWNNNNNNNSKRAATIKDNNNWKLNEIKSTTITIPIVKNNNVIDLSWNEEPEKEIKRHSIAVDEAKYATNTNSTTTASTTSPETRLRRTSLVNETYDDDIFNGNRKPKKVEFCKTEVHFTAESGKVNIVETDEKPPPTQNFRRRRRIGGIGGNFNNEEFHKNGLPMLHFGDTSYEKAMFHNIGGSEEEPNEKKHDLTADVDPEISEPTNEGHEPKESRFSSFSVTVNNHNNSNNNNNNNNNNSNNNNHNSNNNNINDNPLDYLEEDRKDFTDNENIKGILKNKPIKPKPYHLGETIPFTESNSEDDSRRWGGVRLRHVPESSPIWKSTVTVHNSFYNDNEDEIVHLDHKAINCNNNQPEFQKLLHNLRPTKKHDYLSDNENCFANIRVLPMVKDNRRSSWSVSDKVKLIDESSQENNKGYSTKINFGDGEAIVVENDHSTWPRVENLLKDSKQILNRGLVVRIGRQDSSSSSSTSKYSSKMTTQENNKTTTTTTKITIDLSPSPQTTNDEQQPLTYTKFKRSDTLHKFKSTPLVLNTIKDRKEIAKNNKIPQQLEALKKLYEVASHSDDSDADKEVQQLMSRVTENDLMESDSSSVVSGSWSKMKAFRNFGESVKRGSFKTVKSRIDLRNGDKTKGSSERLTSYVSAVDSNNHSPSYTQYSVPLNKSKFSPVVLRKTISSTNALKDPRNSNHLSSPHLVDKSLEHSIELETQQSDSNSIEKRYRNIPDNKLKSKYINENIVLRQPKQSEMTYFGVAPHIAKEVIQTAVIKKEQKISEKPDLLQHHHNNKKSSSRSPVPLIKLRKDSPLEVINNPIYENIKPHANLPSRSKYSNNKDFDSSILDELTKAADQILQAVNGYADEDCHTRLSSDEERIPRKPLDTISETKSWKNKTSDVDTKSHQTCMRPTLASAAKVRVKRTSSTSSVDSLSKDRRKTTSSSIERKSTSSKPPSQEKPRKKLPNESSSLKALTKARRLQRASSREALLQSHGSSSEDLPANVEAPVRRPRLIKKTKATQLTITNGLELKKPVKKNKEEKLETGSGGGNKGEERILESLPEIRHRTAVSTIRSTTEKCSRERDRSKTRSDEMKSRNYSKKECSNKGSITNTSLLRQTTPATIRNGGSQQQQQQQHYQSQRQSKDAGSVMQHRISTANIKKCQRSDATTRH